MEPDRWYYHADRLGLLVWQDMPSMCGANEDTWYADCWVANRSMTEASPSFGCCRWCSHSKQEEALAGSRSLDV